MKIIVTEEADVRKINQIVSKHQKPVAVTIVPYKFKRSVEQNALMWVWYDKIRLHLMDTGAGIFSSEELHEYFKRKLLPSKVITVNGEAIRCAGNTSKLDVDKMSEYLNRLAEYCLTNMNLILDTKEIP